MGEGGGGFDSNSVDISSNINWLIDRVDKFDTSFKSWMFETNQPNSNNKQLNDWDGMEPGVK